MAKVKELHAFVDFTDECSDLPAQDETRNFFPDCNITCSSNKGSSKVGFIVPRSLRLQKWHPRTLQTCTIQISKYSGQKLNISYKASG